MPKDEHSHHLSRKDIHNDNIEKHIEEIQCEFKDGFNFLKKYPKSVTIYGSARAKHDSQYWKLAEELGNKIVKELKYAVVSGGGPGIMEAAHEGAHKAGGQAVALGIKLPHETSSNKYSTDRMLFTYFFARKTMLAFAAEAYVFFPGGYGTFDELFSTLTLIQTRKIPSVPVILIGSTFWNDFVNFINKKMFEQIEAIADYDRDIFKITDDLDQVMDIIRTAPVSEWWRNIN
ncbi:MAG: TIGR00730 family Rossman fold protein [Patescibacteria group bacterium]